MEDLEKKTKSIENPQITPFNIETGSYATNFLGLVGKCYTITRENFMQRQGWLFAGVSEAYGHWIELAHFGMDKKLEEIGDKFENFYLNSEDTKSFFSMIVGQFNCTLYEFNRRHPKEPINADFATLFVRENELYIAHTGKTRAIIYVGEKIEFRENEEIWPNDVSFHNIEELLKRGHVNIVLATSSLAEWFIEHDNFSYVASKLNRYKNPKEVAYEISKCTSFPHNKNAAVTVTKITPKN